MEIVPNVRPSVGIKYWKINAFTLILENFTKNCPFFVVVI
jgi:hypothetical protein